MLRNAINSMSEGCTESEEERSRRLPQKQAKTEMQLPSREVCSKVDEYEREEQRLAKERKHMTIRRNDHT